MTESTQAQTARTFAAAFGTCDIDTIVGCVSDDVVWELNGEKVGEGRAAFEERMRADLASGSAQVTIERLVEEDDVIVALNRGRFVPHEGGEGLPFVSAEVYTFSGDKISRMQTYQALG